MTQSDATTFDKIAAPYDRGMAPLERLWLRSLRSRLLPHAQGRVLEIGVGTGANLPFYPDATHLTAIDESVEMLSFAAQRARLLDRPMLLGQNDVEHLAFPAGYFDTVVASLVLCSVVDQSRALAELRRVLRRPGGRLLLIEHMRPHVRPLAWLTDLANIPWYAFNGRCRLNRKTQEQLVHVGFEIRQVEMRVGGLFRLIIAQTSNSRLGEKI
ncbi:MAG: methyltransferase domain-containing protein [Anaerolineae bacterium]